MASKRWRRHGGPFDRGSADAYYGRPFRPHYFEGASYQSPEVTVLTPGELADYRGGYYGELDRKDWGARDEAAEPLFVGG